MRFFLDTIEYRLDKNSCQTFFWTVKQLDNWTVECCSDPGGMARISLSVSYIVLNLAQITRHGRENSICIKDKSQFFPKL